jgi:putative hydroxymethylpyrimidine transport system substrate-binding protein
MLDWLPNAAHSGLYVAMARGYMKANGIDVKVEVPSDTSDPAKLVGAGSVTFADADIGDVVTARSVGVGITAVMALVQHPLEAILSLKSSHITRPSQLQGHTIGISGDPADYAILDSMVLADHGNPKKVKTVTLSTNTLAALIAGRVDAIIGFWSDEGVTLALQGHKANVMRVDKYGVPYSNELSIIASSSTLKHKPGLVKRFVAAWVKGQQYAIAHPAQAIHYLAAQAGGIDTKTNLKQLKTLIPVMRDKHGRVGTLQPAMWQKYVNWLAKNKLLSHSFNISPAVTNKYLP